MNPTNSFNRDELSVLETRARNSARECLNPYWIRAFEDLAYSLDRIDAMMDRSGEDVGPKAIPHA